MKKSFHRRTNINGPGVNRRAFYLGVKGSWENGEMGCGVNIAFVWIRVTGAFLLFTRRAFPPGFRNEFQVIGLSQISEDSGAWKLLLKLPL